jgi:hypothetical protein
MEYLPHTFTGVPNVEDNLRTELIYGSHKLEMILGRHSGCPQLNSTAELNKNRPEVTISIDAAQLNSVSRCYKKAKVVHIIN